MPAKCPMSDVQPTVPTPVGIGHWTVDSGHFAGGGLGLVACAVFKTVGRRLWRLWWVRFPHAPAMKHGRWRAIPLLTAPPQTMEDDGRRPPVHRPPSPSIALPRLLFVGLVLVATGIRFATHPVIPSGGHPLIPSGRPCRPKQQALSSRASQPVVPSGPPCHPERSEGSPDPVPDAGQ